MNRMGLRFPVPRKRATRFFLRSLGPATITSFSKKPASRKRLAIASAAVVTLPTESVVLISINCFRISRASWFVSFLLCARPVGTKIAIAHNEMVKRFLPRILFSPTQIILWAAVNSPLEQPPKQERGANIPKHAKTPQRAGLGRGQDPIGALR